MEILRYRPLFLCCAVFILATLVGFPLSLSLKCILGVLILAGTILYGLLQRAKKETARAVISVMAGVLACLALLRSHLAFQGEQTQYLHEMEHTSVQITGTVTDRRGSGGYLAAYTLQLDSVNGTPVKGLALLTCYHESSLRPGNEIYMQATLLPLNEVAGDGYDATALMGDGYVIGLLSEDESTVTVVREESDRLLVKAGNLRRLLAARLNLLTGDASHAIPSALLLGDKTDLSDGVRRDFARVGVSHLLAISGFHFTMLFGMLNVFLCIFFVPKGARLILLSAGILVYLVVLGFPPSATRAAIMLGMTYLAYPLFAFPDSLTSLGLAGALILAASPYAVMDAGFWMSFLATMGIVIFIPPLNTGLNRRIRTDSSPWWQVFLIESFKWISALVVGIVAVSFTLSVVSAVIGEMGILSPVATLLLTPFCSFILALSLMCLPFMGTAFGAFLGSLVRFFSSHMADLVAWMGEPSWTVVSLRHPAVVPITVVVLILTLLLLVVRLPKHRRYFVVLPMLTGWILLGGLLTLHAYLTRNEVQVTYLQPSTASDALVLVSGRQGFVCDLSNGSLSSMTSAVREAKQQGATELAVYMVTHYHARTAGALASVLERETVRALWLPTPTDAEEYDQLLSCAEKAEAAQVQVYLYDTGEPLKIFREGTLVLETASIRRSVQPVLLVSLDLSESDTSRDSLVYCGSAVFESELSPRATELVRKADIVMFGNHGPLCKSAYGGDLIFSEKPEVLLSACGDTAAWFDPASLPEDASLWMGQKRMILNRP